MLKVLWVEDDKDNIEEYKDDDFDKIFESIIPKSFKESCLCTQNSLKYDFVVIDIDLTKFSDFNEEYANNIKKEVFFEKFENKNKNFAQVAGFFIYSKLLEHGFPKERIIFLTANAGSQNNTYNEFEKHFTQALMPLPEYIIKDINAPEELTKKLKLKINDYLTLRRGIIEGCNDLKEIIKDDGNIQLKSFVERINGNPVIEIFNTDIENYLDTLAQFLPIRQPESINEEYRLFLRTLVHLWEEKIKPYQSSGYSIDILTFALLSKQTRNWVSHANLLETLDSEIISFLFLVNMRAMFKLPKDKVQDYEEILLKCISKSPVVIIDDDDLNVHIRESKRVVDNILSYKGIPVYRNNNGEIEYRVNLNEYHKETISYFNDKINFIYIKDTGNINAKKYFYDNQNKEYDFKIFLFQYFWINQERNISELTANTDDFLPTLARYIYSRSFS